MLHRAPGAVDPGNRIRSRTGGRSPAAGPGTGLRDGSRTVRVDGRQALGRYGEALAGRRLTEAGMSILDRNWRCRYGEIDIVASDGDAVVICEVKTRRANGYEHPMAAVTPRKAERLKHLAARWLADRWLEEHGTPPSGGVRIDLVGVLVPSRGAPLVEHVRGVT